MALVSEVTTESFSERVLKSKEPVLVDFWATWCGPCQQLAPKLEEIAEEVGPFARIVKINTEECPEIATQYSIRGVPSLLFFKGGEIKNSLVGNHPKEKILAALNELL